MRNKILVLQGAPASGKSTFAREFIKGKKDWVIVNRDWVIVNRDWVIVNRDSIRNMRGDYWIPSQEDYISNVEMFSIENALQNGLNVIIDATNLNPSTIEKWKNLAEKYSVDIEFKEFKITFKEAVERDSKRENPVGEKVIKKFFRKYYPDELKNESVQTVTHYRIPSTTTLPKAIICDIDGTLAWMNNRSPFDYTQVKNDNYDERLVELIKSIYADGIRLIIVSGREGTDQCMVDTIEWLNKKFDDFFFFQRKKNDYRPDEIVKEEIYHNFIENVYDVICVFDNRNKVVNMWRNLGLLCCQVNDGNF